jgi:hypothetical protein
MKQVVLLIAVITTSIVSYAQDTTRKVVTKTAATTKPVTLQNPNLPQKRQLASNLPKTYDLKITAYNVTSTPYVDNGVTKYNVLVTATIKNEGNAAVLTDNVSVQGYVTNDYWYPTRQAFNRGMTGIFQAAGGRLLGNSSGRGETLEPGATKQITIQYNNKTFAKDPKPVYLLSVDDDNSIQETDESNNVASAVILL